ncbi:MAG: helix-turn-helix transcriptional regulator [Sneathiella sp.]|nr:helix-turn-helix transcriptional regulator [Sneathiella sp.]
MAKTALPKIADTEDMLSADRETYWHEKFGQLWGAVDIVKRGEANISGAYSSKQIGQLTFTSLEFGNQSFERRDRDLRQLNEPFYSLSFPNYGRALCEVGGRTVELKPNNVFLINNSMTAKLHIDNCYGTFNVKIPTRAIEDRIGIKPAILDKEVINPDLIYHMLKQTIGEFLNSTSPLDERTTDFVNNQILDAISFYLSGGDVPSEESIAMEAHKAKAIAYIEQSYRDDTLSPQKIAAACNISKSYLYKIFSNSEPVMERLKRKRLEAARKTLTQNPFGMTMTQIAYKNGFKSSSEFSRLFKLEFGEAPSWYRAGQIKN